MKTQIILIAIKVVILRRKSVEEARIGVVVTHGESGESLRGVVWRMYVLLVG